VRTRTFLIAAVVLVILAVLLLLNLKKPQQPLPLREGNRFSQSALVAQAKEMEAKGQSLAAKDTYQELVNNFPASPEVMNWQRKTE
jgi:hypothetical protein